MLRPSITSTSSAQADGQSCGQVELRIRTLACWFMAERLTSKTMPAERIYPAAPMRLPAEIGPPVCVDRLARDVARGRAAQEPDDGGDVLRLAARARDGAMGQVMRRFRLAPLARRADQARNH